MSHTTNQPQMIRKKARELLPGDLAGRARMIASWYRVNRLVS